MRHRPTIKNGRFKAALLMLLAVQLVLGLQLRAAQAAALLTMPSVPVAGAMAQLECPTHSSLHGASHGVHATASSAKATGEHLPAGHNTLTHDCCHASACQCHCVYTLAAIDLPALANIATFVAVPSWSSAQFVAPRIDEFLRPPIA